MSVQRVRFSRNSIGMMNPAAITLAEKWFDLDAAAIEKSAGRYTRGKHKGDLRGYIVWREVVEGGWLSGIGVCRPGMVFAMFCPSWDAREAADRMSDGDFYRASNRVDTRYGYDRKAEAERRRTEDEALTKDLRDRVAMLDLATILGGVMRDLLALPVDAAVERLVVVNGGCVPVRRVSPTHWTVEGGDPACLAVAVWKTGEALGIVPPADADARALASDLAGHPPETSAEFIVAPLSV